MDRRPELVVLDAVTGFVLLGLGLAAWALRPRWRVGSILGEDHPGGAGYLLKQRVSSLGVLTDALMRLRDGECVIDPTIVARLVKRARPARQLAELTEREREVLALMAEGPRTKQSAPGSSSARRLLRRT